MGYVVIMFMFYKDTILYKFRMTKIYTRQGSSEGAFLRYFSHQNPEKRTKIMGARLKNACRNKNA